MKKIMLFHQGAELYGSDKIFEIVTEHVSKGNEIFVIVDSNGPLIDVLKNSGAKNIKITELAVLRKIHLSSFKNIFAFIFKFFKTTYSIKKEINRFKPDIVYVNTLAVISPLLASAFNTCLKIHHLHEIQQSPYWVFRILYSISGLLSNKVLCVSKSVIDCYQSMSIFGKDKAILVHNGLSDLNLNIDPQFQDEVQCNYKTRDLPIVAYVARVHSWKGQLEFLDAIYELIHIQKVKANFAFFGDVFPGYENLKVEIENKIKKLEIGDYVHFFGFRTDTDQLFCISEFSIMGSTAPDPLPTIVLESMRSSTPVIAYSHGGSIEMIEHNLTGLLVPPKNSKEMTLALKYLLLNRSKTKKMGDNAKVKFLHDFSIGTFQKKIAVEMGLCDD
jgi:glycosyltransferase involved in cell wall biosynthesis